MLNLKVILLLFIWSVSANETVDSLCPDNEECPECGTPAWPVGVDVFVKRPEDVNNKMLAYFDTNNESHIQHMNQLLYRCSDENDLIVGNDVRDCNMGRWIGEVPRCAINLMNETRATTIEIVDIYRSNNRKSRNRIIPVRNKYNTLGAFTPSLDLQPEHCLKWNTSEKQIWMINLSSEVNVQYIRFKLYAENLQQIWNNREFVLNIFLNSVKDTECGFNPEPNTNYADNGDNNDKNKKNYLTLKYDCETSEDRNQSKAVHKIIFNFSYVKKLMKLLSISLCDLRLYNFDQSCGGPDYPTTAQVRRSYHFDPGEQYEFVCKDNEHKLEGKTHIKCGPNGKWVDEFPFCVPFMESYCTKMSFEKIGKNVIIEYDGEVYDEFGHIMVPNGKMAKFTCTNNTEARKYRLQGISSVLCGNGKWQGLTTNDRPECVPIDSIPIPKRIIKILAIVLIICVTLILLLVFLMVRTRKAVRRKTLEEIKNSLNRDYKLEYENDYGFDENKSQIYADIPHIYYSCDDLDSFHGMQNNSIYKDDLSDKFLEIDKTNSIYSNL